MREDSMHGNILHTHTCTQILTRKYILTCIHTLTNTQGLICTCTHALTDILPSTHTLRVHKKNHTLTCMNSHRHTCTHTYMYTNIHFHNALTHVCTQTHTCIHTFTYKYSHAQEHSEATCSHNHKRTIHCGIATK